MATNTSNPIRPTKKQRELLSYIEQFIREHGYSPSYREIMNGLNYTSVATVSLHVTSLIRRGHLRKRDRSARSLEVVASDGASVSAPEGASTPADAAKTAPSTEESWLTNKIAAVFKDAAAAEQVSEQILDDLGSLVQSLRILGLEAAAEQFAKKLDTLSLQEQKNG